ncbi:hypothetical protein GTP91_21025 [Rugamonas sp. FT82W]|uniref:Uncharacterized protein n=1 Tax=Duganella vulcania TaxID=2692166 RepID=A0A845G7S3_9BURK|nr:hypothetical protein [Duganella vulcania]MYM89650.1 hypothetical protein [Duganella vulcania]
MLNATSFDRSHVEHTIALLLWPERMFVEPLKSFNTLTEPDGRWAAFRLSLSRLYEIAEQMTLSADVPEYVLVQFQQAQHLLVYSHLQFSLLSVALTQALICPA